MNVVFDYINATNKSLFEALKLIGLNPIIWNRINKSAFDMFDETKPIIAFLNPETIDRSTYKAIHNHNTKLIFAIDNISTEYAFKLNIEGLVKYKLDTSPFANIFSFGHPNQKIDNNLECEFLIMSDWLDGSEIHKAIHQLNYNSDVKIVGNRYVSHPWYIGYLLPPEERLAISAARNVILSKDNINELNVYIAGSNVRFLNDWSVGSLNWAEIMEQERTSFHLMRNILSKLELDDKVADANLLLERYQNEYSNSRR